MWVDQRGQGEQGLRRRLVAQCARRPVGTHRNIELLKTVTQRESQRIGKKWGQHHDLPGRSPLVDEAANLRGYPVEHLGVEPVALEVQNLSGANRCRGYTARFSRGSLHRHQIPCTTIKKALHQSS